MEQKKNKSKKNNVIKIKQKANISLRQIHIAFSMGNRSEHTQETNYLESVTTISIYEFMQSNTFTIW